MNLSLDMSMKLQQKLSFQMIQSLKLLQVNTLQLEQMLKTELEMNPVLEASEDLDEIQDEEAKEEETTDEESEDDDELDVDEDSIDWEEYLEEGFDLGSRQTEEVDRNQEYREPTPVYHPSLEEHLSNQLAEKTLSPERELLVHFLIGSLDPDGFLRLSVDEISDATGANPYEVEEAMNVLWSLEPAGIGARTLQECLAIQVRRLHRQDTLAFRIVTEGWSLFERLKVPDLARKFGVSLKDIQEAIDEVKKLHPKPGYLVSPDSSATIIPDLIVEKVDGEFIVNLNDRSVPLLHISRAYADMLKRGSNVDRDVKKYVREKFNNATWLIRSIEQRKSTMLKVMYAIIEKQRDFFEKGPPNLKPLKLQDVADMIEMHISTVSRVTSNKYVQTPHGIYELKYFFIEGVGKDGDGEDVSSAKIRNRIRELVENENSQRPMSDQRIADVLSKEDLKVARRTVAKYREQMKILPARLRQKYG